MRVSGLASLLAALVLATPAPVAAHPMGNFSISHYAAIQVEPERVRLHYVLDLAEIPTFQVLQAAALPSEPGHPRVRAYLDRTVEALAGGLVVELDGRRLPLRAEASELIFPPGAGGLPTLKLGAVYRADLPPATAASISALTYRDDNYPGRAGWKEIVATAGPRVTLLGSTAPERDRSRALADYPAESSESPPQAIEARVVFSRPVAEVARAGSRPAVPRVTRQDRPAAPGAPGRASGRGHDPGGESPTAGPPDALAGDRTPERQHPAGLAPRAPVRPPAAHVPTETSGLAANVRGTPRDAFTALIAGRPLGVGTILFALAVAASLGMFHALEPGHGKTVVAAYLVGARGTAWHACLLGLVVTASHTAGVYLLGAVTLYASQYVVPERLYPGLGVASGLLIVALGVNLMYRRLVRWRDAAHAHVHDPGAPHGLTHDGAAPHGHDHGPGHHGHHHHLPEGPVSLRSLVALGVSGGIVPCPAALVVLLSAVAGRRVGLGLLLIVAFSAGLATVLIALGLLVVCTRRLVGRFEGAGREGLLVHRWLPFTSAAVMTVAGLVITVQALGR
jgi:ABC-type nickel/cobalt efflux system permease component RcnA